MSHFIYFSDIFYQIRTTLIKLLPLFRNTSYNYLKKTKNFISSRFKQTCFRSPHHPKYPEICRITSYLSIINDFIIYLQVEKTENTETNIFNLEKKFKRHNLRVQVIIIIIIIGTS